MKTKSRPALFLDRDGVINRLVKNNDGIYDSPLNFNEVNLVADIEKVILFANSKNIPVIIVTNQPNIAHGKITPKLSNQINNFIHKLIKKKKAFINGFYVCPHHPDGKISKFTLDCNCRKPKPGLLLQAASDFGIDLTKSILIGDRDKDIDAGLAVCCKTILFLHEELEEISKQKIQECQPHFRVTSHLETLSILEKLFFPNGS